jgi:uncharacterized Zn finger protein
MRHKGDRGIIKEWLVSQAQITKKSFDRDNIDLQPISIQNQRIAITALGKAWCCNLDRLYAGNSKAKQGKKYARAGAVLSLAVEGGEVHALVQGMTEKPVEVALSFSSIQNERSLEYIEKSIKGVFGGENEKALQGLTGLALELKNDLLPGEQDIKYRCKCIEWRQMCWHIPAVLYGIGSRLDEDALLLYELRKVPATKLVLQTAHRDNQ